MKSETPEKLIHDLGTYAGPSGNEFEGGTGANGVLNNINGEKVVDKASELAVETTEKVSSFLDSPEVKAVMIGALLGAGATFLYVTMNCTCKPRFPFKIPNIPNWLKCCLCNENNKDQKDKKNLNEQKADKKESKAEVKKQKDSKKNWIE